MDKKGLELFTNAAVRSHKIPTLPYAAFMFVFASKNKRVKIHSTFIWTKTKGTPFGVPFVLNTAYNFDTTAKAVQKAVHTVTLII